MAFWSTAKYSHTLHQEAQRKECQTYPSDVTATLPVNSASSHANGEHHRSVRGGEPVPHCPVIRSTGLRGTTTVLYSIFVDKTIDLDIMKLQAEASARQFGILGVFRVLCDPGDIRSPALASVSASSARSTRPQTTSRSSSSSSRVWGAAGEDVAFRAYACLQR